MESKSTFMQPPVETTQDPVEVTEVKCLERGDTNMLGAVRVGGSYSADCFEDMPHGAD